MLKSSLHITFTFLFICCIFRLSAKSDTLNSECQQQHDSLYALADDYYYTHAEKSKQYAFELLELAKNCDNQNIYFSAYLQIGWAALSLSDFPEAVKYADKATTLALELNDFNRIINAYNLQGNIYLEIPDKEFALNSFFNGIKAAKNANDSASLSMLYNNVAIAFEHFEKLDSSLYYYQLSEKFLDKNATNRDLGLILVNIGDLYYQLNQIDSAFYFNKKARKHLSLEDDKDLLFIYYLNTAVNYADNHQLQLANIYLDSCFATITDGSSPTDIELFYHKKSALLFQQNEFKKAYEYLLKAYDLKDSILSKEVYNKLRDIKIAAVAEKKEAEIQQHLQENKILELEVKQSKASQRNYFLVVLSISIVLLFTVILILYSIRNNKRLKKRNNIIEAQSKDIHQKNNELELKNTEITDSINYAKRIQDAILPSKEDLIENLKNGFVIFKPKDIVSGDFYWLESLPLTPSPSERAGEGRIFFAAADCTGHGVPGAMVSVMCSNALSKALLEDNITDPGKILDRTRDLVIERFAKSKEDVKDGMDIALVSLEYSIRADSEEQKFLLKYAGANNPLWIIRNLESPTSSFELIELKPNKQPVGKSFKAEPFDTHVIELKKGDSIYLLTDGYPDQFGGEKGKKLKKAPLKEILLSIQHLTMDEQKTHLENFFEQWKGDLQQVDDVCVIGVRI